MLFSVKIICLEFYFLKFKIFNLYTSSIHFRGISYPFPVQWIVGTEDESCVGATWSSYSHSFKALSEGLQIFPPKRWSLAFSSWSPPPSGTWLNKAVDGMDGIVAGLLPPCFLWGACSNAHSGRAMALCPLSPEYNWDKQTPVPLPGQWPWPWEVSFEEYRDRLRYAPTEPEKDALVPQSFHWIPFGAESGWVSGHHLDSWTWWQWARWGMCPQSSVFWSICPLSSSPHCSWGPSVEDTVRLWRPWCTLGPLPSCLWEAWCKNLIWGSYKLCWLGRMSCLPRKIAPGESDPGSLVGYSTSWGETWDLGSESRCPEDGPEASDDVNEKVQKPWPLLNCLWEKPSSSVRVPKMQENLKVHTTHPSSDF